MKSPDRFLSDANTNDRIPHRRLVMKAKGSVPAHAMLARYSLPLVAQFVGSAKLYCSKRVRKASKLGRSTSARKRRKLERWGRYLRPNNAMKADPKGAKRS